jgi:hypothetical protein
VPYLDAEHDRGLTIIGSSALRGAWLQAMLLGMRSSSSAGREETLLPAPASLAPSVDSLKSPLPAACSCAMIVSARFPGMLGFDSSLLQV